MRKAILHIATRDKCRIEKATENYEICASSTISEGKACKVSSVLFFWHTFFNICPI